PEALSRTLEIADRCNVHLEEKHHVFPHFEVPTGETLDSFFEKVTRQGFALRRERLEQSAAAGRLRHPLPAYEERLEREIELVKQMRFAGYFLIVWDFMRHAREQCIPVGPGRGSAAGSLAAYSLRITDIDPLQHDLLFERFLTPELRQLKENDQRVADLLQVAGHLEGLVRHASTHAAGVVISPQPLQEIVPLYKSNKDEITTQYAMDDLEKIGLLKMDFLGLTTLTVIDDCVKLIEVTRGEKLDLENLPVNDEESYALLAKGLTAGIFQFESRGMTDILQRVKPNRLADLTALNALYRPGPLQGGMIDDYVARKTGKKRVTYDLPQLKEILEETHGVIVYQEQVIQIFNRVAGFTLGEADVVRRAMGKKKHEEMVANREKFLAGAKKNNVPAAKAERLWELVEQFAGYGFNKSHSAAYALVAYQTAYLKTHYPVEFMSALLSSEIGNQDKMTKYLNECRDMNIPILPPDVNSSHLVFTPAGDSIRFGLTAIKNVGAAAIESVLAARRKLGRFDTLLQFCENVDLRLLNKRVIESLIKAGAFDSLGARRSPHLAVLDRVMDLG